MSTESNADGFLRVVLVVLAVLVLFPLLMMVFAMPMMGWWWDGRMVGDLSPLWGIGMLLVWLVVLVGIGYVLYRGFLGGPGAPTGSDPALEELRVAYARGDISDEEFERRHEKLDRTD